MGEHGIFFLTTSRVENENVDGSRLELSLDLPQSYVKGNRIAHKSPLTHSMASDISHIVKLVPSSPSGTFT